MSRGGTLALLAAALILGGCEDVRHFRGEWEGTISSDPNLALGFPAAATLRARVTDATSNAIQMGVQLAPPDGPWIELMPIRRAAADVLGEMHLPGDPLRTFWGVLQPESGGSYLALTSLYAEDRVEVRLIRGAEETYAVFSLHRVP